jgi:hypothetical protein
MALRRALEQQLVEKFMDEGIVKEQSCDTR